MIGYTQVFSGILSRLSAGKACTPFTHEARLANYFEPLWLEIFSHFRKLIEIYQIDDTV